MISAPDKPLDPQEQELELGHASVQPGQADDWLDEGGGSNGGEPPPLPPPTDRQPRRPDRPPRWQRILIRLIFLLAGMLLAGFIGWHIGIGTHHLADIYTGESG